MKSIKSLPKYNSNQNKQTSHLPSIQNNIFIKNKRQKIQTPCAFHPSQLITNFCKNINCLLPLCPKCVKIHMQEHTQLGTTGKFQTIQECFDEAHQAILNVFTQATKLQKTSLQIQQTYLKNKDQTLKQFQKSKLLVYQTLDNIFKSYEQTLKYQITLQNKAFTESLIEYHDLMSSMMQNCKNETKKFSNKNTLMQGLIGFYSNGDTNQLLKKCEQKLSKLKYNKIQILVNQNYLSKLESIIKSYIRFGESKTLFQPIVSEHKRTRQPYKDQYPYSYSYPYAQQQYLYPQIMPSTSRNRFLSNNKTSTNQKQSAMANRSRNDNSLNLYRNQSKNLSQINFLHTDFIKINTLLDNFSLQRLRNTRMNINKIKNNNLE